MSRRGRLLVLAPLLGLLGLRSGPAAANPLDEARACLDQFDLPCAQEQLARQRARDPDGVEAWRVGAWVAFHEGRYDDALAFIEELEAAGVPVEEQEPYTPYRPTAGAAAGLLTATGDGVVIRHAAGIDRILADQAIDTLEAARTTYDGLFGGGPEHPVVLDIYPTAARFTAASGLPAKSVQTTNVIALSKWTRLLVTSPRALSRGYGWKDTIAHEYIHLVVAKQSHNRAPVWLQEGLAKHLEGWWRDGTGSGLAAHHESLLAEAVAKDEFVPFEKFARSMAYLDSSEEAALAFAQVSTLVQFLLERSGPEVLPALLTRIRDGEEAMAVAAALAGYPDWDAFHAAWRLWVEALPLVQQKLSTLPVVLDGEGGEFADDPLLAGRPDLARFTRLGDLLRDRGLHEAALIEYDKATDPDGPPSPTLLARKAVCLAALDRRDEALAVVSEGARLYPEFSLLQVTRGRLLEDAGRTEEAVVAFSLAQDVNPYNPEVQDALVRGLRKLGQDDRADRHLRYARLLASGGTYAEDPPPPAP